MSKSVADSSLTTYLQLLHIEAGLPPTREIASAISTSHTWVADIIKGKAPRPRWHAVYRLVVYLRGDVKRAQALWNKHTGVDVSQVATSLRDQALLPAAEGVPIHELVVADVQARMALDLQRYGHTLHVHDDRNTLEELYEALLEGAVCVRQLIEKQKREGENE